MADRNKRIKTPKASRKKSKISKPNDDDDDWSQDRPGTSHEDGGDRPGTSRGDSSDRPGTSRGDRPSTSRKSSKSRPTSANKHKLEESGSRPNISVNASASSIHERSSTSFTSAGGTPTGATHGMTYRDYQESLYPAPMGKKHSVMGKKAYGTIANPNNIESAVKRGIKQHRKIEKYASNLTEEQLREVTQADESRLTMMANYFAEKIEDYQQLIEKCIDDGRKKREKNAARGIQNVNALSPFMMSKKFYNMMEAGVNQVYVAYRRLTRTVSGKKMSNYDHIMYDDEIHNALYYYQIKFVHLVCKPYQCWMNLFQIDETAAKDLSEVALLVLEHFNKVARYKQAFPKWLIDLRGWEHSIAMQYLSKPVHVYEIIPHIKNGNYWARYHQYLREENDDVYVTKWKDGTDFFPHKSTTLYWYFHESDVDHWMGIEEYMDRKTKLKSSKSKRKLFKISSTDIHATDEEEEKGAGMQMQMDDEDEHKSARRKKRRSIDDEEMGDTSKLVIGDGNDADTEDNDDDDVDDDVEEDEEELSQVNGGDGGLEFLDLITVSDTDPDEMYSSSASIDSIPVNKDVYRCPEPVVYDVDVDDDNDEAAAHTTHHGESSSFAGWTAYHESFVTFMNRDLLEIEECEREIARNPSEDHWRRRHLHRGNGFDLPICQYRLIMKKLNLEHEVRENLRMIAILKKNGISARAPATQSKYMPEWVKFKAQTHFNKLLAQIRKQQQEYTPQKKQLLDSLKAEIEIRERFNSEIRGAISGKKGELQMHLNKLGMLHDRQISLLDYIVTAKHRVANAKLKVAYARKQVELLENDVKDLREMTPREQAFAARNKRYYEAVSINKLCKQYHSLKRNNYDPNEIYLSQYRSKIKRLLKNAALYNLWYWCMKQRYKTHKKFEVMQTAYDLVNPSKDWTVDDTTISEMLLSDDKYRTLNQYDPHKMRKEHFIFHLQQQKEEEEKLPDDDEDEDGALVNANANANQDGIGVIVAVAAPAPTPQIERDRIAFEKIFYKKKGETAKYAALNMGNPGEEQEIFDQRLHTVLHIMSKFRSDEVQQRTQHTSNRQSISSTSGYKRRRISEHDIPAFYDAQSAHSAQSNVAGRDSAAKAVNKDVLDRQLAGGQRIDDEEDSEFDDDDQWYDDDEYEAQNEEEKQSDTGTDNTDYTSERSDSYSSDAEDDDDDDKDEVDKMYNYESNPQIPSLRNFEPTVYLDDGGESIIYTDEEQDDDDDDDDDMEEEDIETADQVSKQDTLTGIMGNSGYMTGGGPNGVDVDEYETGDSESVTDEDEDEYETGDEELVTDNEYEEEKVAQMSSQRAPPYVNRQGYSYQSIGTGYGGSTAPQLNNQLSYNSGYGGGGGGDSTPTAFQYQNSGYDIGNTYGNQQSASHVPSPQIQQQNSAASGIGGMGYGVPSPQIQQQNSAASGIGGMGYGAMRGRDSFSKMGYGAIQSGGSFSKMNVLQGQGGSFSKMQRDDDDDDDILVPESDDTDESYDTQTASDVESD